MAKIKTGSKPSAVTATTTPPTLQHPRAPRTPTQTQEARYQRGEDAKASGTFTSLSTKEQRRAERAEKIIAKHEGQTEAVHSSVRKRLSGIQGGHPENCVQCANVADAVNRGEIAPRSEVAGPPPTPIGTPWRLIPGNMSFVRIQGGIPELTKIMAAQPNGTTAVADVHPAVNDGRAGHHFNVTKEGGRVVYADASRAGKVVTWTPEALAEKANRWRPHVIGLRLTSPQAVLLPGEAHFPPWKGYSISGAPGNTGRAGVPTPAAQLDSRARRWPVRPEVRGGPDAMESTSATPSLDPRRHTMPRSRRELEPLPSGRSFKTSITSENPFARVASGEVDPTSPRVAGLSSRAEPVLPPVESRSSDLPERSDGSGASWDGSRSRSLSLSGVLSLAQSLGRALSGASIGRAEVTRRLVSVGMSEADADALYTHVLLSFDGWTKAQSDEPKAPFTLKRGCEIEGGRVLARSLEVVPEGHAGGPAVLVRLRPRQRAHVMQGAQKEIKPTLVLIKRGEVLVSTKAARARAIETDLRSGQRNRADLEREAAFMGEMSARQSPGVLPLVTTYELPRDASIARLGSASKRIVVTELMSGSLHRLLDERTRPKDEAEQRELMLKIAQALADLHAQGVLHNDVKENNFFYSGPPHAPRIVIADFALSSRLERGRAVGQTGSPFYASPGTLSRPSVDDDGNIELTRANDVWALGLVFHRVVTGKLPSFVAFDEETGGTRSLSADMLAARTVCALLGLTKEEVDRGLPDGPFKTLLSGMLEIDDDRRWPLDQVIGHLEAGRATPSGGGRTAEPLSCHLEKRVLTPRQAVYVMTALAQQVMRLHGAKEVHGAIDLAQVFIHRSEGRVRFELERPSSVSPLGSRGSSTADETPFTEDDRDEIESLAGLDRSETPPDSPAPVVSQRSVERLRDVSEAAELKMQAILELACAEDIRALGNVFDALRGNVVKSGAALPSELDALIAAMTRASPRERPDIRKVADTVTASYPRT